jgi:phosphogluconate dehydratase
MGYVIRELLDAGLLHDDVTTIMGHGLRAHSQEAWLQDGEAAFRAAPAVSGDDSVLRPAANPFSADGGLKVLTGNIGRAVIKVSAVKAEHRVVEAPAVVFHDQNELLAAFKRGELEKDFVAVIRFQGPRANGMPELHKLTPPLGVLQERGFKVALVTDGRMSGASGKVPAAIHVSPEALLGGDIGKVRNGDLVRLDANTGELTILVDAADWAAREHVQADLTANQHGVGRDLFAGFRQLATAAEDGAMSFAHPLWAGR